MKTIEKSMYQRPELTAFVQEQLKQLDQHIHIDAENHGARNKPPLLELNINSYVIDNHHKAQALIGHVGAELQPAILVSEVIESEKIMERKLQALQNKLVSVKEKAIEHEKALKGKQREYSKFRLPLIWLAICVPLLGDGMLNRPTFETYGYNFIESLAMSILVAASLAVLAHSSGKIISLGKTIWQRRAIVATILFSITALFYYLADTRASYLSNEAATNAPNSENIHFSPIPFCLLSVLLFVIAVAINHFFFPTNEQRKAMREYQVLKQQCEDNVVEQQRIEQEMESLKQQYEELRQVNGSIYVYGGKLEDMIISHAQAGFGNWKKVSMMHRPDNGRPLCFDSDEYSFTFQRNFRPINLF